MSDFFESAAISASAGCGKTEEMAIQLLRMFIYAPDISKAINSTMAVTFSKSGAKEIYNRMLELLFNAILKDEIDELHAKLETENSKLPEFDAAHLTKVLKDLIFSVNDLKICTIDSFMNKTVRSFAAELGLPLKAELITESEENLLKENVIRKLLISPAHQTFDMDDEFEDMALESQKTAYGQNSRKYFSRISSGIEKYEKILDDYPNASAYKFAGNVAEIFSREKRLEAWETLETAKSKKRMAVTQDRESFYDVMKKIHTANTDTHFKTAELNRMRDFYAVWEDLKNYQTSSVKSFSKEKFEHDEISAIIFLLQYAAYILLEQNSIRSDAFLNLTANYRKIYADTFYRQGKLTFNDLPRLLGNTQNSWTFDIAYRLNNRFTNYLIDEFQDTSRIQWQVLSSIFDTPDGDVQKKLFIVGDVKQAIYGWRSGDRRLMGEVIDEMKSQIGMQQRSLDVSFRYGSSICSALNMIFDGNLINNAGFFPGVGSAWKNIFSDHNPSTLLQYRSNFEFYLPETDENAKYNYAQLILKRIRDLNIIDNRRSCAILVRTNKEGISLLDELQQDPEYGDFFMWEGNDKIDDNKLIICLIHLLIYIQHPADTMAREIANMLKCIRFLIPRTHAALQKENHILAHSGFYNYLKNCICKIQKQNENNNISYADIESIELFLDAAGKFDNSSIPKDSRYFKEFIKSVKHSKEAVGYKIRIMTIHHSKGLTFDHVFCAFFKGSSMISREKNIPVAGKNPDGSSWILHSVNEEFSVFPEINKAWNNAAAEQIFEKICLMYVAFSRARYTCSVILPKLSGTKKKMIDDQIHLSQSKSYFFTDYITELFFCGTYGVSSLALHGNVIFSMVEIDDYDNTLPVIKNKNVKPVRNYPLQFIPRKNDELRRRRIRPSDGMDSNAPEEKRKLFFNLPDESKGKNFGAKLHAVLCATDNLQNPVLPDNCPEEIKNEVLRLRSNPEICALLADFDECWKEKTFDVIVQDYYISGCFDRVQIKRSNDGKIISAAIIDYKSGNFDPDDTEKNIRYHRQLNTYRIAASQLLHLPVTDIKCFIIWTAAAVIEEVAP